MRIAALILGLAVAAWGGVIAYRVLFLEPTANVVVNTNTGRVHEYPNMFRLASGLIMLAGGAGLAVYAARRRPM